MKKSSVVFYQHVQMTIFVEFGRMCGTKMSNTYQTSKGQKNRDLLQHMENQIHLDVTGFFRDDELPPQQQFSQAHL